MAFTRGRDRGGTCLLLGLVRGAARDGDLALHLLVVLLHLFSHFGFRISSDGLWVLGFDFRGSGFRVQGAGSRVQGAGFRVQGSGFRVQGSGFRVQGP